MLPLLHPIENRRFSEKGSGRFVGVRVAGSAVRPLPLLLLTTLFVQGIGSSVAAQELLCLSPALPLLDLPDEILVVYRAEISGEFESYFAAVTEYIACLDSERARVMAEARDAAATYSDFLNLPHVEEDIR